MTRFCEDVFAISGLFSAVWIFIFSVMFPHASEIWALLSEVKIQGFMPLLILVPDPDGPLALHSHNHSPIHSELGAPHLDILKKIVER